MKHMLLVEKLRVPPFNTKEQELGRGRRGRPIYEISNRLVAVQCHPLLLPFRCCCCCCCSSTPTSTSSHSTPFCNPPTISEISGRNSNFRPKAQLFATRPGFSTSAVEHTELEHQLFNIIDFSVG